MVENLNNFFEDKNVLITGHTGFKGSWLLLILLKLKAKVWGFSLEAEPEPNLFRSINKNKIKNFNHIVGDICNKLSLDQAIARSQPDIVFHLAAQPLVRKSYQDPILTWETNLNGTLNLLDSLSKLKKKCSVVLITTDKVYKNKDWKYGYRENDQLGGSDPYSASKAATELLIESWRKSFCHKKNDYSYFLKIGTARAGNVIGGGDWAEDRIIPDIIRSLFYKNKLKIRNKYATRPWQHVIEPLYGYILLSIKLYEDNSNYYETAFNFGPNIDSNKTVLELINEVNKTCQIDFSEDINQNNPAEEKKLNLDITKSRIDLNWIPKWSFSDTIHKTIIWYKDVFEGASSINRCYEDIDEYFDK